MDMQNEVKHSKAFSIIIIFILFFCVGALLISKLSVQLLPSQTYASLTITSTFWGASTEVTELELTSPLEAAVSRMKGVSNVSSISDNGRCQIKIQLDKWTDPNLFRFEVSSLVRQLFPKLPENISYPQIYLNRPEDDKRNQPVLSFTLSGKGSANEMALFVEQQIRPLLAEVKGIHRLEIIGRKSVYKSIIPDVKKLEQLGLNIYSLQEQLREGFRSKELGSLIMEQDKIVIFLDKAINDDNELLNYPVISIEGRVFKLKDIAILTESVVRPSSIFRINGNEQVALFFYPEENVNNIDLVNQIKQKINKRDLSNGKYLLQLQSDQTEYIKEELTKIYIRTGLSVTILLIFVLLITRKIRYIMIIMVSLLANVLLSVICYYFFKLDIHLYSLAGITISLGLVVDNVIVIVEDIRNTGRNRIFAAILASTLTALGALSVIFLLGESQKVQLIDFAIAVIINLLISLPIAYFFIPALLELFPISIKKREFLYRRKRKLVWMNKIYERQLRFMIKYKKLFIVFFILTFGIPIYLLPLKLEKNENNWQKLYNYSFGSDFYNIRLRESLNKMLGGIFYYYISNTQSSNTGRFESEEENQLLLKVTMPSGAQLEQMDDICKDFENILKRDNSEIDVFTTDIYDASSAYIRILFKKNVRSYIPYRIKDKLEKQSMLSGSASFSVTGVGKGFNNSLEFEKFESAIMLKGYNYNQLNSLAMIVRDSLLKYERVTDVMVSSQREWGQKEDFEHIIRFTKAEYLTLNNIARGSMANALSRVSQHNSSIGMFDNLPGMNSVPVHILYNYENEPNIWMTKNVPLQIDDSTSIKFSTISDISKVRIGTRMIRENQEYVLFVNYQFIGSYELNKLISERIVSSISLLLPFGYKIEDSTFKGWAEDQLNYLWFIPIVLVIIYMICSILLESLIQSIAIVAMIPFSFIGFFITFQLLGLQFDKGGYTAMLMLSGLVTNSALYIINDLNFIIPKRNNKIKLFVKALNLKMMPILVTTTSAVLSLLPFMLSGEEKGFWFTLSAGTIGGLLFSLLGVYVLLPILLIPKRNKNEIYA